MNHAVKRLHRAVAPVALAVLALSLANFYLRPERGYLWLAQIATMVTVWLVAAYVVVRQSAKEAVNSEQRFVELSAVLAGLLIAVSLGVAALRALDVLGDMAVRRAGGIAIGIMLLAIANAVPKVVRPLREPDACAARLQSEQRFAGWAFALSGLAYSVAWSMLPIPVAETVSTWVVAAALLFVVARLVWRTVTR